MFKKIGFWITPIGGLIILYKFSDFIGGLANLIAYDTNNGLINGLYLLAGIVLFICGVFWLKGEIGVVFISLGSLTLLVSIFGIFSKLFPFYSLRVPHSIGEFVGSCILLPSSIALVYLGIRSFSKRRDKTIIDDLN